MHKEVKEVTVGVSEEELSRSATARRATRPCRGARPQVHAEAERKKEEIRERAEASSPPSSSARPRRRRSRRLRADLREETERAASQRKRALAAKLKGMENKLLKGGARGVPSWLPISPGRVASFFSDFEPFRAESGPSGRVRERFHEDGVDVAVRESTPREGAAAVSDGCSSQASS